MIVHDTNGAAYQNAPSSLLWEDSSVYPLRRSKTAANIKAVSLKLPDIPGPDKTIARFQSNYDSLCGFPSFVQLRLFEDPYCYYWTRVAFELARACLHNTPAASLAAVYCAAINLVNLDSRQALKRHLEDFTRILLGAALLAQKELRLAVPLRVNVPFAIPGTEITFSGSGTILIDGCDGSRCVGHLECGAKWIASPGQALDSNGEITVDACPRITSDGHDIRLQPAAAAVPLENIPAEVAGAPMQLQRDEAPSIQTALALINRLVPDIHRQLLAGLRVIGLYEPPDQSLFNASHCDLPGFVIANPMGRMEEYGIALIHEFYHSRLFSIEEKGAFFNRATISGPQLYYSPWRNDRRPAHGVLHAIYVHVPVARYLLALLADTGNSEIEIVTQSRLARIGTQLKLGVAQLDDCEEFSDFGEAIFALLKQDVNILNEDISATGVMLDDASLGFERISGDLLRNRDSGSRQTLSVRGGCNPI